MKHLILVAVVALGCNRPAVQPTEPSSGGPLQIVLSIRKDVKGCSQVVFDREGNIVRASD